jgi:formimidoylglutamate deiminase
MSAPSVIHASSALLPGGWQSGVRLTIEAGRFAGVETGVPPQPADERCAVLLPSMPNLHSHAFQRGMAGLAERRGPGTGNSADSFWSWRDVMYRFALSITPEQLEAVAAQLYVEMLEAGFCRVGEFHYLHHAPDGRAYGDIAELAARIAAAAQATGIGLTLLPVFYAHASFGGAPPTDGQRRFINTPDSFARLLGRCRELSRHVSSMTVGLAPHSLRAVTPDQLALLAELARAGDMPVHMHIAEQMKEVEDCVAWSGQTPVAWLLDHAEVDDRWCLIHATHMTDAETMRLAKTGAVAGLCPVTEANLGDGTFKAPLWLQSAGVFGIGSDSNVQISVQAELRQLEYSQRLALRVRNVIAQTGGSCGRRLFDMALRGGIQALRAGSDQHPAGLAAGAAADCFSLDLAHPAMVARRDDALLDAWIFAANTAALDCAWVAGRKLVTGGRHRAREVIAQRFARVMAELAAC